MTLGHTGEAPPTGAVPHRCSICLGVAALGPRAVEVAIDGLCWSHIREIMTTAPPGAVRLWRQDTAQRFEALADELRDYLHKCDWNFRHEPRGAEQDSWLRALHLLGGTGGTPPNAESGAPAHAWGENRARSRTSLMHQAEMLWRRIRGEAPARPDIASVNIEAALALDGCPICRLGTTGLRRWLWILLWEGVMDPEIRNRIRAGDGFCPEHWWHLYEVERTDHHGRTGLAILEEDILRSLANQLRQGQTPAGPLSRSCLACQAHRRSMDTALAGAARHLTRPSFLDAYLASPGCCPPHSAALGQRIHDPRLLDQIIAHRGAPSPPERVT